MTHIGYFLCCEQFDPHDLIAQARRAEEAGFHALWVSDHFHPWTDEQGQSPFVWGILGALSEVTALPVTTAVTCPTFRMHPAIIAQAAATAAVQLRGGFRLGVGSGEALNEHILGAPWPSAAERLDRLAEAVSLIRALHRGEELNHDGRYFRVQDARIYTLPDHRIPIYVSGFGPQATRLAGRIGDGYCITTPDADRVALFREAGGGRKPVQAGMKVCWDVDPEFAADTAHRLWATEQLPGQLNQILPRPTDFASAASLVAREAVTDAIVCGPDIDAHVEQVRKYVDAGVDEIYVQQIGPDMDGFFDAWERDVLPEFQTSAYA